MLTGELTFVAAAATHSDMAGNHVANSRNASGRWGASRGRAYVLLAALGSAMALSGCISVNTPDKPIVIELNINIKQEVIYRLSADAGKTIDTNKDIF